MTAFTCFFLADLIGYRVVALLLLMEVSIVAMLFDILPVLISAALSALIWNFFFIPPIFNFYIDTTEDALLFIIGLGNFGSSLAQKLTQAGHEVIGVDSKMNRVDALKELVTHTINIDCTDPQAVSHLPLKDADVVLVCIGEDEGANILATALMKKLKVKRLISRAVSPLHETVLEAMGVDEIVHPEEETADRWAKKLILHGVVDSFELGGDYSIIQAEVPKKFIGQTIQEVGFLRDYHVVVMTTIEIKEEKNILGISRKVSKVRGVASAQTLLKEGDILVMYGNTRDIERLLEES